MITRSSPAKGNLFFRVISKRPDGYHEVASLYTALSLCDTLHIFLATEDSFQSNEKSLKSDTSNLVIRAREAFRNKTKRLQPLAIKLEKQIPIGAGFGGGSSNAATTLWAMNELFDFPLTTEELIDLAAGIGSDVAFFFSSGLAYCTGRGEILHEVDFAWERPCWIAKPRFSLSTPEVYRVCTPRKDRDNVLFINDLESAAFQICPELREFKKQLQAMGFSDVVMTGSGSAFLCFGDVANPDLPYTQFYQVQPLRRIESSWY